MIGALYRYIVPTSKNLVAASTPDIKCEQTKYEPPVATAKHKYRLYRMNRIWVPNEATDLELKIVAIFYCREKGHRANDVTKDGISSEYLWTDIVTDINEIVQACINCRISSNDERTPYPLPARLHCEMPNEVLHVDFLYVRPAEEGKFKYAQIINGRITSHTCLCPCDTADHDDATTAPGNWLTRFGGIDWLIADQGSHFKAPLMKQLTDQTHIRHHFSTAYGPWSNGTVECVGKEVIGILQALLSEWILSIG